MSTINSEWAWEFHTKAPIIGLFQSDSSKEVAISDEDGGVYVLDGHGKLLLELGFSEGVQAARVVSEGRWVVVLDAKNVLHAFSTKGKRLWQVDGSTGGSSGGMATALDTWSKGHGIAVGYQNGLVTLYSGRGQKLRSIYLQHPIHFLKFSFKRHDLVAASKTGQISYLNPKMKYEWGLDMHTHCGGIDVDHDASLILLTAFSEGAYAFNHRGESVGAYEIEGPIVSSALCQRGQRIVAANPEGRLHVLRRDGHLEYFLDLTEKITRMDLSFEGDFLVLQTKPSEVKVLRFYNGKTSSVYALGIPKTTPSPMHEGPIWQTSLPQGKEAKIQLTANGAYCVCFTELNQLMVWDYQGKKLWDQVVEPPKDAKDQHRLVVSRAANIILVISKEWVDYFTCTQGHVKRILVHAELVSVHNSGLHFALSTFDSRLGVYDKKGTCVWSKLIGYPLVDIQLSPKGRAVFVASGDGTLRAFRRYGKLGWQKKLEPKDQKLILGNGSQIDYSGGLLFASDGYKFKDRVIFKKKARFVLDHKGITLGNQEGEIYRINEKGKQIWNHKIMEPVIFLKNLREHTLVKSRSGKDFIFDREGNLVHSREAFRGLRQYEVDHSGHLLVMESDGSELTCQDVKENRHLWCHKAKGKISQFDFEITASKVVYLADGKLVCLPIHSQEKPLSEKVAFLEI